MLWTIEGRIEERRYPSPRTRCSGNTSTASVIIAQILGWRSLRAVGPVDFSTHRWCHNRSTQCGDLLLLSDKLWSHTQLTMVESKSITKKSPSVLSLQSFRCCFIHTWRELWEQNHSAVSVLCTNLSATAQPDWTAPFVPVWEPSELIL